MPLIDAHCHLYSLKDMDEAVAEAKSAGVSGIICVSEDLKTMEQVLKVRDRYPDFVIPGLGIHPANAVMMEEEELHRSFDFLKNHAGEADVIGEIGLDYKYAEDDDLREKQKSVLHEQFAIAEAHRLPVNLHSRRALRQTMEEAISFSEKSGLPALLHWFAHSKKLIRRSNEAGLFVSAGPSILYDDQALEVALTVRSDLLLVETDTPVPYSGDSARPSWTAKVADKLIRNLPAGTLSINELEKNTRNYLSGTLCVGKESTSV